MTYKRYGTPSQLVWEDETRICSVNFYPDTQQLFLEVGLNSTDTLFHFKVNINSFWSSLVEFMEFKNVKPGNIKNSTLLPTPTSKEKIIK